MYKHVFFDLDHTLWDFDTNSKQTLIELFEHYKLQKFGIPSFDDFISVYNPINELLWEEYRSNKISKEILRLKRFHDTLLVFKINNQSLAKSLGDDYLYLSPRKIALFPSALEVLDYLFNKYSLHIITNGFNEVQYLKINNSGLHPYFTSIITSEKAGFQKPDIRVFNFALAFCNAKANESIMIGDNLEVDIIGARNASLDQIFFNPLFQEHKEAITYEINHLNQLFTLL